MPAYDKVPCKDCGEVVSMHPMAQKKHKRECKVNPVSESNTVVETKSEPKMSAQAKELYEISKKARETRQKAPELFVAGVHSDERKELVKRYAKECVDPLFNPLDNKPREFAEWHAFFADPNKAHLHAHRGYEPVIDEHGDQVQHDGDLLFKIPREMWLHTKLAASEESKIRRERTSDAQLEKDVDTAGDGISVTQERHEESIE